MGLWDKIKHAVNETVSAVENVTKKAMESVTQFFFNDDDLLHKPWEERLSVYQSLKSVEGYVKAIRLYDFHNPENVELAGIWKVALDEHPEFALEIYNLVQRNVSNSRDMWRAILDIHAEALKKRSLTGEQSKQLREITGLIRCFKLGEADAGKLMLGAVEYKSILDNLKILANEKWDELEKQVEMQVGVELSDANARSVLVAHCMADYAVSIGDLERACGYIKSALQSMGNSSDAVSQFVKTSLLWRVAIFELHGTH